MKRHAYTLIELLTVMAVTAVLLTIIVYPVFTSFNFTRQALAFGEAQQRVREIADKLAGEISSAAAIRDNGGTKGTLVLELPGKTGGVVPVRAPYAKLDIFPPAQEGDGSVGGGFVNPGTGKIDPTLTGPKGTISLPLAPGFKMVRYAISLRDPFSPYNNPYDGLLMARGSGRDNLYVLRRFEIQPYKLVANAKPVVNTDAFYDLATLATFTDSLGVNHVNESGAWFDDPDFLNPTKTPFIAPTAPQLDAKAKMVQYWLNHSQILTEVSKSDMIQPVISDKRIQAVMYELDGVTPRISLMAQFKPTRVASEAAQGQVSVRSGEEQDNAALIGPESYRTERGAWSNVNVRAYLDGYQSQMCVEPPLGSDASDSIHRYLIARANPATNGLSIYSYNPITEGCDETNKGVEVFDLNAYANATAYPFTEAIAAANSRSGWTTAANLNDLLQNFVPFVAYNGQGQVRAGFAISEVGNKLVTPTISGNLPSSAVHLYDGTGAISTTSGNELTPLTDTAPTAAATHPYSPKDATDGANFDVNMVFNRAWAEQAGLRPDIHRFLDLRTLMQNDGSPGPLDPAQGFPRAVIVPGSEEITGPDQNPGPNHGHPVRYVRVAKNPGLNQYRINYIDQTEPDYSLLGLSAPPATYNATNFVSAVIQPRFKAGYVQFNSDANVPIPFGYIEGTTYTPVPIVVNYRFQFTRKKDVVAVDYDTRQVMSVLLSVKNIPPSNAKAAVVTIPATAKVRTVLK